MAQPPLPTALADLTQRRDTARTEQALLQGSGLAVPTALALLEARIAFLENKMHDGELALVTVSDAWLSWLRVPVTEIDRLGMEPNIGDFSFRDATHYYLDGADGGAYRAARQAEGSGELLVGQRKVSRFPFSDDINRMDDYRARGWKPSG
jgi:hypothetical protein